MSILLLMELVDPLLTLVVRTAGATFRRHPVEAPQGEPSS